MIPFVTNPSNQQGLLGYLQMGATYDPRTSTVLSSAFDEARSGRGSAINDVAAGVIARETGNTDQLSFFQPVSEFLNWATFGSMTPDEVSTIPSGVPMSEEEWKKSPYYVEGMPYLKGLTTQAAAIQFSLNQRQAENEFVMDHASRAQSVGAFGAGFVGSLADVKQLPLNVAAAAAVPFTAGASLELRAGTLFADGLLGWSAKAAATGEIGLATRVGSAWVSRVTTTGAKAIAATTPRALAGVAAEGALSTIPTVATAMANAPLTGQEYTFEDGVRDTLFSVAASGALHLTGTAIHAAWSKYARPADVLETGRTALAQVANGEKIDVEPLVRAAVADYTPKHLTPPEPIARKTAEGVWEASIPGDTRTVYRGATEAEAITTAKQEALAESLDARRVMEYSPEARAEIERAVAAKQAADPVRMEATALAEHPRVVGAEAAVRAASPKKLEAAKANLEKVKAEVLPAIRADIEARKPQLEAVAAKADQAIRAIQSREASKHLPDYARKQLDQSLEARAERSFDPQAGDVIQDRVSDVKYDDSAPPSSLTPEEATEFEQLAARVPESDVVTHGDIKFLDVLKKSTDAVIDYAKCKAGV